MDNRSQAGSSLFNAARSSKITDDKYEEALTIWFDRKRQADESNARQEAEVVNEASGKPNFYFTGEMANRLANFNVHLTLSHDAGIASAMVVVER